MMADMTNVVVVGVGYLGRIHARIYHEMSNVNLVAVVDTDPEAANQTAEQYDCRPFYEIKDLFQAALSIDAVSIVVPTTEHLSVAEPFLRRKIHMMLEKPIATTAHESETIVALARQQEVMLQIGHLERFNAGVMKLAEILENPRFIEVHRLSVFNGRAADVDVVTDLMIHDIDIILSLVPSTLATVSAIGTPVLTPHVDIANARLEFANGAVANVTASRISRNPFRRIRVFAEKHYFGLNFTDQQLEEIAMGEWTPESGVPQLMERQIPVDPQLPLNAELAHFIHCVQQGTCPLVSGEDALVAVKVAERIKEKISLSMENRT